MVRDHQIDCPARPLEKFLGQARIRPLRAIRYPAAQGFEVFGKADAKVLGLKGAPRFVRRHALPPCHPRADGDSDQHAEEVRVIWSDN